MKTVIHITCEPERGKFMCVAQVETKPNYWVPYPFSSKRYYLETSSFAELNEKMEDEFGGMDN